MGRVYSHNNGLAALQKLLRDKDLPKLEPTDRTTISK